MDALHYGRAAPHTLPASATRRLPALPPITMKHISDKNMEEQDRRAEREFLKSKEEFNKKWDNERGGYLRDLINKVENLYVNK